MSNNQINTTTEAEIWKLQLSQSNHLIKSGALPEAFKNAEQVLAVIQYGRELDLPPMTALQNISLIKGKPTLSANLIGARLKKAGYKFKVIEYNKDKVIIKFTDLDGDEQIFSYTVEEAKSSGNYGKKGKFEDKGMYEKYGVEMLYARCLTRGGRIVAPEVLTGIYAPEEFSDNKEESRSTANTKTVKRELHENLETFDVELKKVDSRTPSQIEDAEFTEQEKAEDTITSIVAKLLELVGATDDLQKLKEIWESKPSMQGNDDFRKAVIRRRKEIEGKEGDNSEVVEGEDVLLKDKKVANKAEVGLEIISEIAEAKTVEELDKIKKKFESSWTLELNQAMVGKKIKLRNLGKKGGAA